MTVLEPLYRTIAQHLRAAIARGVYAPGDRLPTEQDLTETYGVARHTAREALSVLLREGLITRRRGIGTIVVDPDASNQFTQSIDGLAGLLQYARDARLEITRVRAMRDSEQRATGLSAKAFSCIEGVRRTAPRARPIAATRIYVRRAVLPPREDIDAFDGALNELIAARFNVRAVRIEQDIAAVLLSARDARALYANRGEAALMTTRRYFDATGEIFQLSVSLHPGDRFTYRMQLDRS